MKPNKGNKSKKWLVAGLALILSLGLTACSTKGADKEAKKSGGAVDEPVPEYTYVAKSLELPSDMQMGNVAIGKDAAYSLRYSYGGDAIVIGDQDSMTEEGYQQMMSQSSYAIMKYPLTADGFGPGEKVAALAPNTDGNGICVDEAGNIYCVTSIRPPYPTGELSDAEWNEYYERAASMSEYHLVKLDANGNQIYDVDFTESLQNKEYFYAQNMCVDKNGRIYLNSYDTGIMLFDENGKYVAEVVNNDANSWIYGMGTAKDGNAYAVFFSYMSETSKAVLSLIDFEGKKFGKSYENLGRPNGNMTILPGTESDVLICDSDSVQEYSFEKQESTKLLSWMDCDIDGNTVSNFYTFDGKFYALINNWNAGTSELAMLTKMRTEDVVKRETITVGVLYTDQSLNQKILQFNKSNDKYRVTVKTYLDENNWSETSYEDAITTLTNDLIAKKGPDILDLSALDVQNLAKKGVLEDLAPYLAKSSVLNKEDFLDRIIQLGTYDGKLVSLASSFTLETLTGKTSLVGDREGWTVSDMIALKKAYPKSQLFEYESKEQILSILLLMVNIDHFVDRENNTCKFDTPEFKEILEFANMFPADIDYEAPRRLTPYMLADDSLLLNMTWFYGFRDIQSELAYFDGAPVTFIGFPNYVGSNGCVLNLNDSYGINAASSKKDAAWSFLESVITTKTDDYMMFDGFPTLKSLYQQQKDELLEVKYVRDENGEILKDIDGNPIVEDPYGMGGYTMIGDNGEEWTYEYKPVTKEEIDKIEELIAGAQLQSQFYDQELSNIIYEEVQAYFTGAKNVNDVANVIQNRVNLYLKENN
ncbi:MAG: extracellular solute-binding protein [Lachnospiraceae bacterium]|nr:extracellular solute-binding protein [Lachnospiraceae bacterium]